MSEYKGFEPEWYYPEAPEKSYRSIFKWGDPSYVKVPNENLYKLIKEKFRMTDDDFRHYDGDIGLDTVSLEVPVRLSDEHIEALKAIAGEAFVDRRLLQTECSVREDYV